MERVTAPDGTRITYEVFGSGPPLVLVHGTLTNRNTNWFAVKGILAERFTLYAVDRRGRGETSATEGHSTGAEFEDIAAVVRSAPEPVFLLGHSYGAQVALGTAAIVPELVRELVLYEPPVASSMTDDQLRALEDDAARGDWDAFVAHFLTGIGAVSEKQAEALRATPIWKMFIGDARATLGDVRAFKSHDFKPEKFTSLRMPFVFLCGSESAPVQLQATDTLVDMIPNARKVELRGQGHEAMFTAPAHFTDTVIDCLLC